MLRFTPLAFAIFQLMWIVPAVPPVQSSVFGIVIDTIVGFVFGVGVGVGFGVGFGVGLGVGFGVARGVGVGPGPGVAVTAGVDDGWVAPDPRGDDRGPEVDASGLSAADWAALPKANARGD